MDTQQLLMAVAGLVVGAAAAWGGAVWWFGRQLKTAHAKQDKVDKAREFAAQQASQARRQIEALQKELGELRLQVQQLGQTPRRAAPQAPAPVEMPILGVDPTPPRPAADGFAETQVMPQRRR
jgi:uncharacterized protein YdgA (DUF945 family)